MQEFPEIITNPEVVRELIRKEMINEMYPLFMFPFKLVGNIDEFKEVFKGDVVGPYTEFNKNDLKLTSFERDVARVYRAMAWNIGDRLNKTFFETIKENIKTSDEITLISNKFIKWSEKEATRLEDIKNLCKLIHQKEGYELKIVFVNSDNYYEFWDEVVDSDGNTVINYDKEDLLNVKPICDRAIYLKDVKVWLIGVDEIPEGSMVGVCARFGNYLIEILTGLDSKFGNFDYNIKSPNIPINIKICEGIRAINKKGSNSIFSPWSSSFEFEEDLNSIVIGSWLDFKVNVKKPDGAFYLENVI